MIHIEDVENHILSNTNQKMISCLRLSGFNSFVDYTIFNETTVLWIEKYIGIRCSLLPPEERLQYIDEEFINSPEKYMFIIPIRQRLLKSVFELHQESEKLMEILRNQDVAKNDETNSQYPSNDSDNVDELSDVISVKSENEIKHETDLKVDVENFESICRQKAMESIPENHRKFYNEVIQFASEEFIECYLVPFSDFKLTLPDFSIPNLRYAGRYHCSICSLKKRSTFSFKFRQDQKIQFTKIKKHLMDHFTVNPDAPEIRKQNRLLERKKIRKRKLSSIELPVLVAKASERQIITAKKFIQENKKKIAPLSNEIINDETLQNEEIQRSFSPPIIKSEHVIVKAALPSICDPQLTESIEVVEVVIEPSTSNDNQINTDLNLSESDIEESNLSICIDSQ